MDTKALRQKILDLAIRGKLVPQDPNDEPASVLLERIRAEKERLIAEGKIKRPKKSKSSSSESHYQKLPKGWSECKIEDVVKTLTDFVASGSFASLRENVQYYDSPNYAILVRTKDLGSNFMGGLVYTDKHGYDFLSNSNLYGGELILPNIGASIGKVFLMPKIEVPTTLAPNSIMIRCWEEYTLKWLYLLFQSTLGQNILASISASTAQGKFNKTDLREVIIPLPPLYEQERILIQADCLLEYVEKINKDKTDLITILNSAKSKILELAMQGKLVPQDPNDEPAADMLRRINPKARIITDNPHLRNIPETWCICHLCDIVELLDQLRKPINSEERIKRIKGKNKSELYPYYGATGQVGYIDDYLIDGEFILLGEDGAPFLDKNTTVAYMINGKSWVNNHAHILSPKCYNRYVLYYLNQIDYGNYVTGSTRLKLTQSEMKNIPIILPPLNEQRRIVAKIEDFFGVIDTIKASLQSSRGWQ